MMESVSQLNTNNFTYNWTNNNSNQASIGGLFHTGDKLSLQPLKWNFLHILDVSEIDITMKKLDSQTKHVAIESEKIMKMFSSDEPDIIYLTNKLDIMNKEKVNCKTNSQQLIDMFYGRAKNKNKGIISSMFLGAIIVGSIHDIGTNDKSINMKQKVIDPETEIIQIIKSNKKIENQFFTYPEHQITLNLEFKNDTYILRNYAKEKNKINALFNKFNKDVLIVINIVDWVIEGYKKCSDVAKKWTKAAKLSSEGKLTTNILPEGAIEDALFSIKSYMKLEIPVNEIHRYRDFTYTSLFVENYKMYIHTSLYIPIKSQTYKLSYFYPIPFITNDNFYEIETKYQAIAIFNKMVIEMTNDDLNGCMKSQNVFVCPSKQVLFQHVRGNSCLGSLFLKKEISSISKPCKWRKYKGDEGPRVSNFIDSKFIISTTKNIIVIEHCSSKERNQSHVLTPGNYLIQLGKGCDLFDTGSFSSFRISSQQSERMKTIIEDINIGFIDNNTIAIEKKIEDIEPYDKIHGNLNNHPNKNIITQNYTDIMRDIILNINNVTRQNGTDILEEIIYDINNIKEDITFNANLLTKYYIVNYSLWLGVAIFIIMLIIINIYIYCNIRFIKYDVNTYVPGTII